MLDKTSPIKLLLYFIRACRFNILIWNSVSSDLKETSSSQGNIDTPQTQSSTILVRFMLAALQLALISSLAYSIVTFKFLKKLGFVI